MGKKHNEIGEVGRNVAANVQRLRTGQRLSTTKLAELLGAQGRLIHATSITKIEGGARRVDVDDLAFLAAVLKVDPTVLLSPAPICSTCQNDPPPGFECRSCGASADSSGSAPPQVAPQNDARPAEKRDLIPWWPDAASRLGGLGRTSTYHLVKSGELPSVTIGRRRFVAVTDIDQYVERLRSEGRSHEA